MTSLLTSESWTVRPAGTIIPPPALTSGMNSV